MRQISRFETAEKEDPPGAVRRKRTDPAEMTNSSELYWVVGYFSRGLSERIERSIIHF
jgi:hypothetical protein